MLDKLVTEPFNRLFDQLPQLNAEEQEKTEYAQHCRRLADLCPFVKPLCFARWKQIKQERGNREGQNHD